MYQKYYSESTFTLGYIVKSFNIHRRKILMKQTTKQKHFTLSKVFSTKSNKGTDNLNPNMCKEVKQNNSKIFIIIDLSIETIVCCLTVFIFFFKGKTRFLMSVDVICLNNIKLGTVTIQYDLLPNHCHALISQLRRSGPTKYHEIFKICKNRPK